MNNKQLVLYERSSGDEFSNFVRCVARLMQIDYLSVKVAEDNTELLSKSFSGKWPVLQLEDGKTCISESLSIARYLSNNKLGFYGPNTIEKAQIDQWIDYISLNITPASQDLTQKVLGFQESEIKAFSVETRAFQNRLAIFEKHFKLRNFLVGYSLTLADVYLVVSMISPYQLFVDKKTRDAQFPNLTRFINLNLANAAIDKSFGKIQFCVKQIMPNFEIKIEKAKKPEAAGKDAKKDVKKEVKKDVKKDNAKPKDAKKEKAPKAAPAPVAAATPAAPTKWSPPDLAFSFYDFKTEFVNSKDKQATLKSLYAKWEPNGLSIWYLQYEKFSEKEGAQTHVCNNMLNGFVQRIDEKLRPHSLGCFGVYGQPGTLEQIAIMLWRGSELPPAMVEHPQFEYWTKRKLDVANEADQKIIFDYLTTSEGSVENREVQSWQWYK